MKPNRSSPHLYEAFNFTVRDNAGLTKGPALEDSVRMCDGEEYVTFLPDFAKPNELVLLRERGRCERRTEIRREMSAHTGTSNPEDTWTYCHKTPLPRSIASL